MTARELIYELLEYSPEAQISVIAHNKQYDFSITFCGAEGVEKHNTEEISFYVDDICNNEQKLNLHE